MSYEVKVRTLERADTAIVRETVPVGGIPEALTNAFGQIAAYLGRSGIAPAGSVFGRYTMHGDRVSIEAGFTVGVPIQGEGRVQPGELPGGEAAVCLHVGPYDAVADAYAAVQQWMEANSRVAAGVPWEVYLSPPDEQPPRTEVIFPLARRAS
jgi:effector-binding domain-containing protein